jgi:hypothetical protein
MEHDRPADEGVSLHPWYGPCDCLACGEFSNMIILIAFTVAASIMQLMPV